MRLWSLHPEYLDRQGLVACWREGLLALHVLAGNTSGYRQHPQLVRFRHSPQPLTAIETYLTQLHREADARGYHFDATRISAALPPETQDSRDHPESPLTSDGQLLVTQGQLDFEWLHLLAKVKRRSPEWAQRLAGTTNPRPHPLFTVIPGTREPWEKGAT